ncbi:hypothetical protein GUJ93_ZPchr0005g16161 [Zizania palustris]|uniref:Uncharacterized protein n=1 Tax=Zizania palustris TaxID=103762 RepID=A0A8J5S9E5_ZIZPA|nr:hypothetical protein GUJ93_ZPchr0005g16161 [Zizania palustris]
MSSVRGPGVRLVSMRVSLFPFFFSPKKKGEEHLNPFRPTPGHRISPRFPAEIASRATATCLRPKEAVKKLWMPIIA